MRSVGVPIPLGASQAVSETAWATWHSSNCRYKRSTLRCGLATEEFYAKSVDRFSTWVQFEDAKAGAVIVLLGLGFVDLLGHAGRIIHAHSTSTYGAIASVAFWIAMICAAAVVAFVTLAVKPATHSKESSIFFFGTVATFGSRPEYEQAVGSLDATERAHEMAAQAWQLARIARTKVCFVGWAFRFVAVFLVAWALARLALGLAVAS